MSSTYIVCQTFDLSGHGASDGDLVALTAREYLFDVTAAYDSLATDRNVQASRIGVCGAPASSRFPATAIAATIRLPDGRAPFLTKKDRLPAAPGEPEPEATASRGARAPLAYRVAERSKLRP